MNIVKKEKLDKTLGNRIGEIFSEQAREKDVKYLYGNHYFVAYENDETVGILTLQLIFNEMYIDELVIDPNHRGKGVGTALLAEAENFFKDYDFEYITVNTYAFQAPEFYEKLGFTLEFTRKSKENPKLNRYYYIKPFKKK
ncbi:MAG: GNAT family N-acetyltransferase [Oscillospiraceae bacterium]|jgi:ribosomal protein S18 acetylase RimI-like enzyme|nr:GNAT family N-acetyltransferase [Oscillospiraceae bacterium]